LHLGRARRFASFERGRLRLRSASRRQLAEEQV
jgi:hypothetical protein